MFYFRLKDLKIAKKCDIIFIYREAFPLGTTYFEKRFANLNKKIIYDFDDAIFLNDTSNANKKFSWLKNPQKTNKICNLADLIIVGNKFLYEYAKNYNENVVIIPTTSDLEKLNLKNLISNDKKNTNSICIGWTGSETTIKHFELAIPFLKKLKEKFKNKIYFKVVANRYDLQTLDVKFVEWNIETEFEELLEFDIGIMPLPDDKWSKGKCGFKGLQCMSLKIPVVMSAVGVNFEIIQNGENGFLADTENDWINYLSELIENKKLREQIGQQGYETVKQKYSFEAWKNDYLKLYSL